MTEESVALETTGRTAVIDITDQVSDAVPAGADGVATVYSTHTTCGVAVNEAESRLLSDFETALEGLVIDGGWAHDEIDDNAASHVRTMLVGASETIPVADGSLCLGTWQSVLLVECDGPRTRTISVTVTG